MQHKNWFSILLFFFCLSAPSLRAEQKLELSSCANQNCILPEFASEPNEQVLSSSSGVSSFTGSYRGYISEQCHYKYLEEYFEKVSSKETYNNKDLGIALSAWLSKCKNELSRFNSTSIAAMLNLNSLDYDFNNNPKIQKIKITYDKNTVVTGLLVLKDKKKRPLVIVKNGVFGNAEDTATVRQMLMHLSEESPFHVLILGNLTGDDFIKDNAYLAMGGFEEGRQIHKVIDILTDESSAVKHYIYDIHMLGVSLGGNAALFSSLYNEYVSEDKKIKSHIAYCPVVNLQKSLNHIYEPKPLGFIFSIITKNIIYDLLSFVPYLRDMIRPENPISNGMVKSVLVDGTFTSLKERTMQSPWDLEPFKGVQILTEQDLWNYNNFSLYAEQVQSPLLVIHSSNDFIVQSKENANLLKPVVEAKNNIGFVNLSEGGHCSFSMAYGWPTFSKILQKYILSKSTYKSDQQIKKIAIPFTQKYAVDSRLKFSRYEWKYNQDLKNFQLIITFRHDSKPSFRGAESCKAQDYRFSDSVCYVEKVYSVDRSLFSQLGFLLQKTEFEISAYTRILNTHLIPVDSNFNLLYGKAGLPNYLIFKTPIP